MLGEVWRERMTSKEAAAILRAAADRRLCVHVNGRPHEMEPDEIDSALRMAIEALERDRWIPVTEILPEPKTEVIAAFDDGAVCSLWQNWQNDTLDPFTYTVDDFFGPTHDVTHWRPLPEPPKEET
jgi:hypothetical protein